MLVAVLNGCRVGITWKLLSLLRDARGLSSKCGVWRNSNAPCCKCSSLQVLNLVSRFLCYEVPSGRPWCRLAHLVFFNQQNKLNQEITRTRVYISLVPTFTSILISSRIKHTARILNSRDIMWLAQNNASRFKTHPITNTTLYVLCWLCSTTCNCIIMLVPWM